MHKWRGSKEWMIDMICNIHTETPIIAAIFHQIEYWHSTMREPMNKFGFKYTLQVMKSPTSGCNAESKNNGVIIQINNHYM